MNGDKIFEEFLRKIIPSITLTFFNAINPGINMKSSDEHATGNDVNNACSYSWYISVWIFFSINKGKSPSGRFHKKLFRSPSIAKGMVEIIENGKTMCTLKIIIIKHNICNKIDFERINKKLGRLSYQEIYNNYIIGWKLEFAILTLK